MSKNVEILRARSYYYEFLAMPFFFSEKDEKFKIWLTQLDELAKNPLNEASAAAFDRLRNFSFETFATEQNAVLFDLSYINVPLTASFYEEGRDEGAARLRVIEILKQSPYRRDMANCVVSEDFIGFIFMAASTLLRDETGKDYDENSLSAQLFKRVINGFADEFADMLKGHERADFFKAYSVVLESFIALERSLLAVEAPLRDKNVQSAAEISLNKKPFQTKMPTPKSKIHWDEFTAL